MKRNFRNLLVVGSLGLVIASLPSCSSKGCTDPNATNYDSEAKKDDGTCTFPDIDYTITETTLNGTTYSKITGSFNEDFTLTSDKNWLLSGAVFVDNGATLTIDAGTTVYADDDESAATAFLSILRGGKILAEGSSSAPIVFTPVSGNETPGRWGGIVVNGYAPINVGETAEGEGGSGTYGGNISDDNSGTISYVRVEYAGKIIGTNNEMNGFSFNGVGSGTTVDHIQAYMGADDGVEFFGGTVNVKYAVSTGNSDDSFDWTHGWSGNGQFWVVQQSSGSGDRGIEADNNGDNNTLSPYSNPTLSNLTLVGANDGDDENTGMRLREGTKGKIYNAIVTGFPKNGVRVSDPVTIDNMTAGDLALTNSVVYDNGTNWKDCDDFANDATNSSNDPGVLNGYLGTTTDNAFDPTSLSSWFTSATFIGAVESTNDWTSGWTRGL